MHRYEELERKYYRYKLKKFVIIILVLLIGSGSFYYILENNSLKLDSAKNKKVYILEFNNSLVDAKVNKEKSNILMFSFTIPKLEEDIKKESLKMTNETHSILNQKSSKINFKEKNDSKKVLIKEEKITLNQLIKKFSNSPSFETAIQIAKLYFEKNDLKNAQKWALKANSIDPYRYESWKLFALILIKKKENKKAKEVLNIYLNDYGYNEKIEKLLKSLE